ncbi:MAG: MFS transporter [Anaerolineae bacterium]
MTQQNTLGKISAFFGMAVQILVVVFLARLTIDVGTRLPYPFIPQLADGLGLTIVGFSWLLFIRSMAGVAGPLFGVAADRIGRRRVMAAGLIFQAVGVLWLALSSGWWAVPPMILYGISLSAFIPAEQAYISDLVAYNKRGRALAAIEFSWATSGIVGLPLVGWMIDAFGWRSPLVVLGLFSLFFAALVWRMLPAVEQHTHTELSAAELWRVLVRPNVLATLMVGLLLFLAASTFSTLWSIWLTADFGLTAATLGLIATGIGIAELAGSGGSSLFIDRLGKRRGSLVGLVGTAGIFLGLAFTQVSLPLVIAGLVTFGLFVEFTIVSLVTLFSEQAPEARATVFSLVAFGASIGSAVASPVTALLWENFGLVAVCVAGAASLLVAAALVWHQLTEREGAAGAV